MVICQAGLKNPRGPITVKQLMLPLAQPHPHQYPHQYPATVYLLLFYNNNGHGYSPSDRNPYWLAAGREGVGTATGQILWSQPEVHTPFLLVIWILCHTTCSCTGEID